MDKIYIKKSNTADTRTCDWSQVSKEELLMSSISHINDVQKGMGFFIKKMFDIAVNHDHTKISHIDDFYEDFKTGFKRTIWWEMHMNIERHHFNKPKYIQDDVNLLDIIEMITDGVMAGIARSGEYRHEEIPDKLLRKAFNNTITMLLNNTYVK